MCCICTLWLRYMTVIYTLGQLCPTSKALTVHTNALLPLWLSNIIITMVVPCGEIDGQVEPCRT